MLKEALKELVKETNIEILSWKLVYSTFSNIEKCRFQCKTSIFLLS